MRRIASSLAFLAALLALPPTAGAQELTGTWDASWANAIRRERDGTITVQKMAPAVMRLEQVGDSLQGTWSFDLPVVGAQTWILTGRRTGDRLELVATATADGTFPSQGGVRVVRQEWSATIAEGRLEGEHWLVLEAPAGTRRSGPRPWSAHRRPGAPSTGTGPTAG